MKMLKVGFIGLGYRGMLAVERNLHIPEVEIAAVCDIDPARLEQALATITGSGEKPVAAYSDWKELCAAPDLDLVYICTEWTLHTEIAVFAMKMGHHAAVEVPAAVTIGQCIQLVQTSRETGKHLMMLENCVYDLFEMTTAAMAEDGLFGEIYHAEGGYLHNIKDKNPWRKDFNKRHRGDFYPTHGLGPICRVMGIGKKDRLTTLQSVDSKFGDGCYHTTTIIRTELGHTIILQHNIDAAMPYSRKYHILGTQGYACKYPEEHLFFAGDSESFIPAGQQAELMEKYIPEEWRDNKTYLDTLEPKRRMDYVMDLRLARCLIAGVAPDMTAYDAALWSCVGALSEESISKGSIPVEIPDFSKF